MKKILFSLLILIACNKKEDAALSATNGNGKATFYVQLPLNYTGTAYNYNLIVDGTEHGLLKKTIQAPACNDAQFTTLSLSAGKHTVGVKSLDGFASNNVNDEFTVTANSCITVKAN